MDLFLMSLKISGILKLLTTFNAQRLSVFLAITIIVMFFFYVGIKFLFVLRRIITKLAPVTDILVSVYLEHVLRVTSFAIK